MRYPLSDSDNHLPSIPSVSPESRLSPEGSPQPPSDPELTLQEVNSPVHSTPSTPEGQAAAKRARADPRESDESDENVPSTSDAGAPPIATVQQTIL